MTRVDLIVANQQTDAKANWSSSMLPLVHL